MHENPEAILETERLILRRFTRADLPELYRLVYADPLVKDSWSGVSGTPEEIQARFAENYIDPSGSFGLRAVVRKADGALLGLMGLQRHDPGHGNSIRYLLTASDPHRRVGYEAGRIDAELTYAFGREYWQHGYALEMGRALVAYGFKELGIARLIQGVLASNARSIHLMERLGFTVEASLFGDGVVGVLEREEYLSHSFA